MAITKRPGVTAAPAFGTLAQRPASPRANQLYLVTDSGGYWTYFNAATGAWLSLGSLGSVPSGEYFLALRAPQAGYAPPLDQSGKMNDPAVNTTLFPPTWQASTAVALNARRSPTTPNGIAYKCTTAGTTGATEPTWPTTLGGTVTDGGAVWTAEMGPYPISASGVRHLASLESAALGGASGAYTCPLLPWDMAAGDSLIIRIRQSWHGDNDSRTNLSESPVIGNRHNSTNRKGFQIGATGGVLTDLRFFISDGTNTVGSGHVGDGLSGRPKFSRPPMDGAMRETLIMIDGPTKRGYAFADGVAYGQAEMYNGSNLSPHNLDLSAVTGSTLSPNALIIGSVPGSSTTYDFGLQMLDILVRPAASLPVDLQSIANFFMSRGASGALLPADLMR